MRAATNNIAVTGRPGAGTTVAEAFIYNAVTVIIFSVTDLRGTKVYGDICVVAVSFTYAVAVTVMFGLVYWNKGVAVVVQRVTDFGGTRIGVGIEIVAITGTRQIAIVVVVMFIGR